MDTTTETTPAGTTTTVHADAPRPCPAGEPCPLKIPWLWGVLGALLAAVVGLVTYTFNGSQSAVRTAQAEVARTSERVTAIEATANGNENRLLRIETKLDRVTDILIQRVESK